MINLLRQGGRSFSVKGQLTSRLIGQLSESIGETNTGSPTSLLYWGQLGMFAPRFVCWLAGWFVIWLVGWLVCWLVGRLIGSLDGCLVDWLAGF